MLVIEWKEAYTGHYLKTSSKIGSDHSCMQQKIFLSAEILSSGEEHKVSLLNQPLSQESQTLEYKRALPRLDMLARTIAAFANVEGGSIIIGVDDDLTILGLDERASE